MILAKPTPLKEFTQQQSVTKLTFIINGPMYLRHNYLPMVVVHEKL